MPKEMTTECQALKSKKGDLYLKGRMHGIDVFVNLVKDSKRYIPKLKEGNNYDITFTSYDLNKDEKRVTLFNVSGI